MEEFSYSVKIPKDRVAVIIGQKGQTKRSLETLTGCSVEVDSKEGEIVISGKDSLQLFILKEIVTAIARGFNPEIARLLIKGDYGIEVIVIADYARTKNDLIRLRGRLIGEGGKSRKVIEELTQTHMSVYGKTVSIIGELTWIPLARKAIEQLLKGANHSTVYKMREKKRKTLKREAYLGFLKEGAHEQKS